MRKSKRILSMVTLAVLILSLLPISGMAATVYYTDIPSDAWYLEGVNYVTENNIMTGTADHLFSPDEGMTRAMLVQVLYAASGKPDTGSTNPFVDVPEGEWYRDAAIWCADQGLVSGYPGGYFGGEDPITREQFVTILWRFAGSPSAATGMYFSDRDQADSYSQEAVNWARAASIISGDTGNMFYPKDTVIRAHCAAILKNYMLMGPQSMDAGNSTVSTARINSRSQQTFYLWDTGNMPTVTSYTENPGTYIDDPSFRPTIICYPVPSGTRVKGAVLILAGGSFVQRSNGPEGYIVAKKLSDLGYVSFVLNYRVSPYTLEETETDIMRALRFIRRSALSYGYDSSNISFLGFSAGAMAAGDALLTLSNTANGQTIDSSYRPDLLDSIPVSVKATAMIYGFYGTLDGAIKDSSAFQDRDLPPAFFCYGTTDSYAAECRGCAQALSDAGVEVQTLELTGYGHGYGLDGDWLSSYDSWLSGIYSSKFPFSLW